MPRTQPVLRILPLSCGILLELDYDHPSRSLQLRPAAPHRQGEPVSCHVPLLGVPASHRRRDHQPARSIGRRSSLAARPPARNVLTYFLPGVRVGLLGEHRLSRPVAAPSAFADPTPSANGLGVGGMPPPLDGLTVGPSIAFGGADPWIVASVHNQLLARVKSSAPQQLSPVTEPLSPAADCKDSPTKAIAEVRQSERLKMKERVGGDHPRLRQNPKAPAGCKEWGSDFIERPLFPLECVK